MNPLRAWNRFWFTPISARPLGTLRIVFGLVSLANLAFLAFDIDYWFTNIGMLQGTEAQEIAGTIRPSPLQWIQDPISVRLFFVATAVITVLFTIGWRTRLMGVLLFLATLSIHHRNILTTSGADTLLMIMTFYMMLAPAGAAYSLDARREARRRGGTLAEPLIVPWVQRLIQLHISLIYLNTAILKANGATWLNGTALHFVLNNIEVGRFHFAPLIQSPVAINLMTHGALLIEFSLAYLLWFRATRPWAIAAGFALHGAILLTVNIPIFGELMLGGYLAFLEPDELDTLLHRLDPRTYLVRNRRQAGEVSGRIANEMAELVGGA